MHWRDHLILNCFVILFITCEYNWFVLIAGARLPRSSGVVTVPSFPQTTEFPSDPSLWNEAVSFLLLQCRPASLPEATQGSRQRDVMPESPSRKPCADVVTFCSAVHQHQCQSPRDAPSTVWPSEQLRIDLRPPPSSPHPGLASSLVSRERASTHHFLFRFKMRLQRPGERKSTSVKTFFTSSLDSDDDADSSVV